MLSQGAQVSDLEKSYVVVQDQLGRRTLRMCITSPFGPRCHTL